MTTYWRDKKVVVWSFIAGLLWLGAGIFLYYQYKSWVVGAFWGCIALPWIAKGIFDLKNPYIELSDSGLIVKRSIISTKRVFPLANIEGLLRVERKEIEFLYSESGKRSRVVIMVNELNSQEINRLAQDLRNKLSPPADSKAKRAKKKKGV